jgi:uncharacterized membrane protein required for colicin V production
VDVYVLLDVLLAILIALFIPIGFWRGAYREAFVTLGILFGASLGRFWGETWGTELAAVTRLHESGGAFMIVMLCLISSTFLLGYSSGAAIPVPQPGWIARTLGALIAGANGALLLSFALRDIRVYLLSSDETAFLDNAVFAPFLSEGTGWILLVGAAIFVPIALVLSLFGPEVEEEYYEDDLEYYEEDYPDPYAQRTVQFERSEPPFVPARQPGSPTTPAPAEETRPVNIGQHGPPPGSESDPHELSAAESPASTPTDSPASRSSVDETLPHRPQPMHGAASAEQDEPVHPTCDELQDDSSDVVDTEETHSIPDAADDEESTDEHEVVFGHQPGEPSEDADSSVARCPHCNEDISQSAGFCPRCGARI